MKDYLDSNDTAYLEYHSWRNMSPSEDEDDMPFYGTRTTQMSCDLCKGRFQTLFRDISKVHFFFENSNIFIAVKFEIHKRN